MSTLQGFGAPLSLNPYWTPGLDRPTEPVIGNPGVSKPAGGVRRTPTATSGPKRPARKNKVSKPKKPSPAVKRVTKRPPAKAPVNKANKRPTTKYRKLPWH